MNFLELTQKRFSARSYKTDEIEQEKLNYILQCARHAPSAVNYQPWHFIVVKSEEHKQKVRQCYKREWFAKAPLYIIVCTDTAAAWVRQSDHKNHADIDAAITTEHICLAAADLGIGSCWVCNFDLEAFKSNFPVASGKNPVAIISLGYINEFQQHPSPRKELDEIITIL